MSHNKNSNKLCNSDSDRLLKIWKQSFGDSQILVNLPGNVTLTHTWQPNRIGMPAVKMTVNGIMFDHPLVQNALYGYERKAENRIGNFYEIMLPEMDGYGTHLSATEAYTRALTENGLQVQGDHFHWPSMSPKMYAIHHSAFGMEPSNFSTLTIAALTIYATQYVHNKLHWLKAALANKNGLNAALAKTNSMNNIPIAKEISMHISIPCGGYD